MPAPGEAQRTVLADGELSYVFSYPNKHPDLCVDCTDLQSSSKSGQANLRRKLRLASATSSSRKRRSARSSQTVASAEPSALNARPLMPPWCPWRTPHTFPIGRTPSERQPAGPSNTMRVGGAQSTVLAHRDQCAASAAQCQAAGGPLVPGKTQHAAPSVEVHARCLLLLSSPALRELHVR